MKFLFLFGNYIKIPAGSTVALPIEDIVDLLDFCLSTTNLRTTTPTSLSHHSQPGYRKPQMVSFVHLSYPALILET